MSPGPQGPNQQQFLCPSFATFIIHLFLRTEQHKEGGEGDADTAERIITVAKFNRVDDNYHAHPQVIDSFEVQKCKNYLYARCCLIMHSKIAPAGRPVLCSAFKSCSLPLGFYLWYPAKL